ncbi:Gfo/Idh/MocA family protein [Paracoccus pacificus]|uniref:Gfo/Idh/MocA family protein n=1 Tax=Paracoccus pacificus TaxID=1463598 RepID=A0ABW4R4I7_9RHOB
MNDFPTARLAVIGLGMATKPHLEALEQLRGRVEVSGGMNRTRAKADAVAAAHGWRVFDDIEQIAGDPGTDGVILATPPDQRLEIVETLARAGKHILLEKPIERTLAAAERIVAICERHGVTLGVVFQQRMRPAGQRLRALLNEGRLGTLALVRVDVPWWRDQSYYDQPGRGSYARDGGGVLISQAIHTLDLMGSMTPPVRAVQAMTATTRLHRMEAEDFATAGLTFTGGAVGAITATTANFPGGQESITVAGTLGTAHLRGGELTVNWQDGRSESLGQAGGTGGGADPMAFPCDWHRDIIADFADAIHNGTLPAISGREALRVHRLIDAITRSAAEGRRIEMPEGD